MPPCHSCHGFVTSLQIPPDRRCTLPFSSSPVPTAPMLHRARLTHAFRHPLSLPLASLRMQTHARGIYRRYIHVRVPMQSKLHCNRGCNRRAINQCPIHGAAKRSANFQVDPPRDKTVRPGDMPQHEDGLSSTLTSFLCGWSEWKERGIGVWQSLGWFWEGSFHTVWNGPGGESRAISVYEAKVFSPVPVVFRYLR